MPDNKDCDWGGGTCPQDWQRYNLDEKERWPSFEGDFWASVFQYRWSFSMVTVFERAGN